MNCAFDNLAQIQRRGRSLVAALGEPHLVLSTSLIAGGVRDDVGWIVNHQVCQPDESPRPEDLPGGSLEGCVRLVCRDLGIDADRTATMLTAASMDNAACAREDFQSLSALAVLTAGVEGNAARAGDPAEWFEADGQWRRVGGTINTLLLVNQRLTQGALVQAAVAATEAKTAALQELCVHSRFSDGWATGTGTDQIAVAAPQRAAETLSACGHHNKLGEMVSRAVKHALKQAVEKQNGLPASNRCSIAYTLDRFGADRDAQLRAIAERLRGDSAAAAAALERCDCEPGAVSALAGMVATWERIQWGALEADAGRDALVRRAAELAVEVAHRPQLYAWFAAQLAKAPPSDAPVAGLAAHAIALGEREHKPRPEVERGRLLVVTGQGKGKTTSALGLALRAVGHNMRVLVVQFIKGSWRTGERAAVRALTPDLEIRPMGRGFVRDPDAPDAAEDRRLAGKAFDEAVRAAQSGDYDVVVLDEINNALESKLLALPPVVEFLRNRPERVHLVLTGRAAPGEIVDLADTVSDVRLVRHAMDQGFKAAPGIEF